MEQSEAERTVDALSSFKKWRLSRRKWRIRTWAFDEWGENLYFPYVRHLWWSPVSSPRIFGYIAFQTNDEAVAFCEALSPVSVTPSRAPKRTWTPRGCERVADDDCTVEAVTAVAVLGVLSG